ncbi:MAG: sulfotransferase domain-containing protein [bacterium]
MDEMKYRPSFLIIGAQKCGTTALADYLARHPELYPPRRKEVHYFDVNYVRGLNWYEQFFIPPADEDESARTFDASPYYIFHPRTPERIAQDFPDISMIVLLRNPVDRAYSHYRHQVRKNREDLSFREAIETEEKRLEGEWEKLRRNPNYVSQEHRRFSYLARGVYVNQLKRWFDYFSRDQFLILKSEKFRRETNKIYNEVLQFVEAKEYQLETYREVSKHDYQPMDQDLRQDLEEFYRPRNEKLYELLDRDMGWDFQEK